MTVHVYWKHFGEPNSIYAMFDKVSQYINMYSKKTILTHEFFLHPILVLDQTSDRNSQHCQFLTFFGCCNAWRS